MTKEVVFIGSYKFWNQCPETDKPEFAFIGRSNVGKSSLVNMLAGYKALAKVSSTPGKTQSINFFEFHGKFHLVDLPGFGYAKISKTERAKWAKMIENYLRNRNQLACLFILIDSRLSPQEIDIEFMEKLGTWGIPFAIAYTKTDKISAIELHKNLQSFRERLLQSWEVVPKEFITSAEKNIGKEDILEFISEVVSTIQKSK